MTGMHVPNIINLIKCSFGKRSLKDEFLWFLENYFNTNAVLSTMIEILGDLLEESNASIVNKK